MNIENENWVIALIHNIPRGIRTSILRRFFSEIIENNGFICFHYKHRNDNLIENRMNSCCCFVKISPKYYRILYERFNNKHWEDRNGRILSKACQIKQLNNQNVKFLKNYHFTSLKDIMQLPEMIPPYIMPKGNVGTLTNHFMSLINQCKLPSNLITSLGLSFGLCDYKYGKVAMTYKDTLSRYNSHYEVMNDIKTIKPYASSYDDKVLPGTFPPHHHQNTTKLIPIAFTSESKSADDSEPEEEWDRHCRLNDDVDKQGRTKERLFESDKEIVWDKGGSGLVWYTDAAYWDKFEGTGNVFEERCPDDWDIDTSIYDDPTSGDRDAKDLLSIHIKDSGGFDCWAPHVQNKNLVYQKSPRPSQNVPETTNIKSFINKCYADKEVDGRGRGILEKLGWEKGQGLGKNNSGISQPLPIRGQHSKSGIGYKELYHMKEDPYQQNQDHSDGDDDTAPKRLIVRKHPRRIRPKEIIIATVFDVKEDKNIEVPKNLGRGPNYIKYR